MDKANQNVKIVKHGHKVNGEFAAGNKEAAGHINPRAAHVAKLRAAFEAAVSKKDIEAIIAALKRKAKKGDTKSADIIFDRIFGKPIQQHDLGPETMETLAAFLRKL